MMFIAYCLFDLLILLMHDICLSIWIECFGVHLWIGIIKLIVASAFRARLTKSLEVLPAHHQDFTPTRISGKHTSWMCRFSMWLPHWGALLHRQFQEPGNTSAGAHKHETAAKERIVLHSLAREKEASLRASRGAVQHEMRKTHELIAANFDK